MRNHKLLFATLAVGIAIPAAPALAQSQVPSESAKEEKITDKDHPDYVKCRSEKVIGSRAKRIRTCLTNREWEEFARRGNDNARKTVEQLAAGGPNST